VGRTIKRAELPKSSPIGILGVLTLEESCWFFGQTLPEEQRQSQSGHKSTDMGGIGHSSGACCLEDRSKAADKLGDGPKYYHDQGGNRNYS
jgi:hypothetical protein